MWVGIAIGIGAGRFAGSFSASYNNRVLQDGGVIESSATVDAASALLRRASLLLIPSGYKEAKVYAEIPSTGNGDLTWSRTSDAWRTYSDGTIRRTAWNLLQYSEQFNDVSWTKTRCSITANATAAPTGAMTADVLVEDTTASASHPISQSVTLSAGSQVVSVYVKAANRSWVQITLLSTPNVSAYFNLSNGTIGTVASATNASIQSVGNGWYRCSITAVTGAGLNTLGIYPATADGTNSFTGSGTDAIYIWGAQVIEGSSSLPYFPTTTRQNVPRLSYMYGKSPALLLEPQRTNLQLYSEQFDNATYWSKVNSTVTANATTAPDGNNTADKLMEVTGGSSPRMTSLLTLNVGTTYTFTIFAKASERSQFRFVPEVSTAMSAYFDLSNGTVFGVGANATASIQSVGNGWYRCRVTYTAGLASSSYYCATAEGGSVVSSGDSSKGIFFFGAQLEAGSFATTYIPTTTASVTRLADSFTRNNIYTNGLITSAGGTWYVELKGNLGYTSVNGAIQLGLGNNTTGATADNLWVAPSSTGRMRVYKQVAGSFQSLFITTTDNVKIAIKWNGTTADVFANGVKVVSSTAFTPTQLESLRTVNVDQPYFIQQMALYNAPLSDADCIALTSNVTYNNAAGAYGSIGLTAESITCTNYTTSMFTS